jgi:TnpA family transposase
MRSNQRLQILTDQVIAAIYDRPRFNDAERRHYFSLTEVELSAVKLKLFNGRDASSKLYFILQLGYFKAKHMFFRLQYNEVENDFKFILNTYMPNDFIPKNLPTKKLRLKIQNKILNLLNFRDKQKETNDLIFKKSSNAVRKTNNPIDIFHEILNCLETTKVVFPPYSRLQDVIGLALKNEEIRIINTVKSNLTRNSEKSLRELLKTNDNFYKITELKFDAKSFQTKEMQSELNKLSLCKDIYQLSKKLLPKVDISRKNITHYSDLAKLYTVYRLKRLPKELTYFYLICYVQGRYEKITNNLIQGFCYYVDKYNADAKIYAEDNMPDPNVAFNKYKKQAGELIRRYTDDDEMKHHGRLIQKKAYKVMSKEEMINFSQSLLEEDDGSTETDLVWKFHKNNYQCILHNLRPLFIAIDFEINPKLENLMSAITCLKNIFSKDKKLSDMNINHIPVGHISPKKILKYFFELDKSKKKKSINTYQYEFYVYNAIRSNLKKGRVFVNDSVDYKSFDEDIKISPDWIRSKEKILNELNNKVLSTNIDDTLSHLKNQLEPLIIHVNKRAIDGENKHIKITNHRDGTSSWTLPYPKKNDEYDNPFYDSVETITISEVFDFVEQRCGFVKAFKHIKPHYAKSKLDYLGIKATILANGTTQGIYQFSKRSNLKYQRLQTVEQDHVRLETLRNAAGIIIDYLVSLPIFEAYHLNNKQHGSIDGKKKKTKRRILKSRHSTKYFGLDIGVVIMTMNLNNLPFVTNIIGANEHESHYRYSMLMENLTSIDPDIISTDTGGTNNVNDLLYYVLGKTHAACYRSIADKAETISGFKSIDEYEELLIKPGKQVKQDLIKEKWRDILPILVSLLSHETKQHTVVSKLSSHDYKNDVKDALWELNNILKSIHILKCIDDPNYRCNIRTALNRGEGYHQLLDKITDVGSGDFRGMSELEVEIWNECTRLTALIIIAYNMCILSELYQIKVKQGDKAAIEFLKHLPPIASQHINIGGLYEFSEDIATINIHAVVDALNKILDETMKE